MRPQDLGRQPGKVWGKDGASVRVEQAQTRPKQGYNSKAPQGRPPVPAVRQCGGEYPLVHYS
jgi:hypothetical protein